MVQIVEQNDPLASLGQATGQGLSAGLQMLVQDKISKMQAQKLLQRGFTPKEAGLWQQFTEGGKTHLAKEIVERMQRQQGLTQRGLGEEIEESETIQAPEETIEREEEFPIGPLPTEGAEDTGLTPKEKVSRQEARYKTNIPLFQEAQKKYKSAELEGFSIQRLQELNESGELPKGLQLWNVNFTTGEIRFPFMANPETQTFIKTINDFTTKAKDSFGARVTNFELERFMKRLPQLVNTDDGRRSILRQMEIVNDINKLHAKGTVDAFDKRGGLRKIDFDQAEKIATKDTAPQIEKLRKEYVKLDAIKLKRAAKKERQTLKKVKGGTEISEDIVDQLLQKSAGDIDKAKDMARKLGYEF